MPHRRESRQAGNLAGRETYINGNSNADYSRKQQDRATSNARRHMRLRSWQRVNKGNLIGIAGISLPVGPADLEVDGLPVLMTAGKAWAAWPGKPIITKEGTVAKIPGTGKAHYVNILRWSDREMAQRFSRAVVDLARAQDPGAFAESGQ